MEKRQRIEEALKEIGIYTVQDLNRAIKEEKNKQEEQEKKYVKRK